MHICMYIYIYIHTTHTHKQTIAHQHLSKPCMATKRCRPATSPRECKALNAHGSHLWRSYRAVVPLPVLPSDVWDWSFLTYRMAAVRAFKPESSSQHVPIYWGMDNFIKRMKDCSTIISVSPGFSMVFCSESHLLHGVHTDMAETRAESVLPRLCRSQRRDRYWAGLQCIL